MILQKIRTAIGHSLNGRKRLRPCSLQHKKLNEITKILVVANALESETNEAINNLKQLTKELCPKSETTFICYSEPGSHKQTLISYNGMEYFGKKDFSFFFKINNENLRNYLAPEYDLAFFIASTKNTYIKFISNYIRARIKVGRRDEDTGDFNFMIDTKTKSKLQLTNEMIKNLEMIFG